MGQYKKILRILAACLSMVLFFSALSLSAGAWEAPDWRRYGYMVDVPEDETDWRYDGIYWCVGNGVMTGKNQREFAPNDPMTRAEFMQVMYSLMTNLERDMTVDDTASLPFTDIETAWYTPALRWCYQNGIVNGVTETTMEPNSPVTRAQMAQMLYVIITEYFGVDLTDEIAQVDLNTTYVDGAVIPQWVQTQARAVTGTGLYVGSDGYFNADNHASRAEIAAIAKRLYTYYSSTWECYLGDLELVPTMIEDFDGEGKQGWNDQFWTVAQANDDDWQIPYEDRMYTEDGNLYMDILYPGDNDTSDQCVASLISGHDVPNKFGQSYGYYEIRFKPSAARGICSAWWLTSNADGYYPEVGLEDPFVEMDIFETGTHLKEIDTTLHDHGYDVNNQIDVSDRRYVKGSKMKIQRVEDVPYCIPDESFFDGEFHTIGFLWTADGYSVWYDGNFGGTFDTDLVPTTKRAAVLRLNAYYWNNYDWASPCYREDFDENGISQFVVDYVHVYQLADYVEEYPPNYYGNETPEYYTQAVDNLTN